MQMQAAEKKRPKEEKDIIHRLRPFARLETAEDFEVFSTDILCTSTNNPESFCSSLSVVEAMLRKRIQDLQHYRRMGLTTAADIDKYENDIFKRVCPIVIADIVCCMENNTTIVIADPSEIQYVSRLLLSRTIVTIAGGRWTSTVSSRL